MIVAGPQNHDLWAYGFVSQRGTPKFRTVSWSSSIFDILNLSCSVTPEYHMVAHYIPINNSNTCQNVLKYIKIISALRVASPNYYIHCVLIIPNLLATSWMRK